jgi:hypothetical protein
LNFGGLACAGITVAASANTAIPYTIFFTGWSPEGVLIRALRVREHCGDLAAKSIICDVAGGLSAGD